MSEEQKPEQQNLFEPLIERERKRKGRRTLCLLAVGTAIICYLLLQIVFGIAGIEGRSMEPELCEGDVVIFNRLARDYEEGDIVIAGVDGQQIVKRIQRIEDGRVFLAGDNQAYSIDSRSFGEIDRGQIRGEVICVIRFYR